MQRFAITTTVVGILAAGTLRDMGYNVQLNGTVSGPLAQCIVTGVHGLANGDPTVFTTAYVDVSCPASDD